MIAGDATRASTTSGPLEKTGADRVSGMAEPGARWEHHVQPDASRRRRGSPRRARRVPQGRAPLVTQGPSLSRIPFREQDEAMIASLAGWMKFIGLFTVVAGLFGFFVMLLITAFLGLIMHAAVEKPEEFRRAIREGASKAVARAEQEQGGKLTAEERKALADLEREAGRLPQLLNRNRWAIYGLALTSLLTMALCIVAGYQLVTAADDLNKVARTDLADQDLLADGLGKVATYFKIGVAITVISALVSSVALASFAIQLGYVQSDTAPRIGANP
jgi:hypothetical protein